MRWNGNEDGNGMEEVSSGNLEQIIIIIITIIKIKKN